MNRIFRIVKIALYETRIMIFSSRFLVLSLLSFVFMDMAMRPVREFAGDYHLTIVPAVLPFYFSNVTYCNIAFLLLILLYSDIPLNGVGQNFLLQRGQNLSDCGAGHVLSLWMTGFLFVAEQVLFSVITALPNLTIGNWGKVWGAIATTPASDLGYRFGIDASDIVLRRYMPWQAIVISAVLFFLTGCIYGLIEYLLNGLSRGKLGTAVLSIWSLGWVFLQNSFFPGSRRLLTYSPQYWTDLSRLEIPDVLGRAGGMAGAVLLLSLLILVLVRCRKIVITK